MNTMLVMPSKPEKKKEVINFASLKPLYWKTWEQMTGPERVDSLFPEETPEEKEEQRKKDKAKEEELIKKIKASHVQLSGASGKQLL